jgi:hypothetical protein
MQSILIITVIIITATFLEHCISVMKKKKAFWPKQIWTYMESDLKIPTAYKNSMKTWTDWNPDYTVVMITDKNFHSYITLKETIKDSPLFKSQPELRKGLICLALLKEHGGVWMEPDVVLTGPLEDWLFTRPMFTWNYKKEFTAFQINDCVQTWFLSSVKNSKFVLMWFDELTTVLQYPMVDKYVAAKDSSIYSSKYSSKKYMKCQTVVQLAFSTVVDTLHKIKTAEKKEYMETVLLVKTVPSTIQQNKM